MPHFWLLTLKYGPDYRKAGFPVLNDIFSDTWIRIIMMTWILASSAFSIMMVYFKIIHFPWLGFGILTINMLLVMIIAWQLFRSPALRFRLVFTSVNLFWVLVMGALIANVLIV